MPRPAMLLCFSALALAACTAASNDEDVAPEPTPEPTPGQPKSWPLTLGGERPALVFGPAAWTGDEPLPVVVLLHGYGVFASVQDLLWRLGERVELDRFLLVMPDGSEDADERRFWNATPGCCNFYDADVDDVGYLFGLIDELSERGAIDPDRVHFTGHSNGGFMSYRLACERPERIASIAVLAGSTFATEEECGDGPPVSVLHMHGDADTRIPYGGKTAYPGAVETARRWAERAGCQGAPQDGGRLNLVNSIEGDETAVLAYRDGCAAGRQVELWTIEGATHVPVVNDEFGALIIDWMLSRPRR